MHINNLYNIYQLHDYNFSIPHPLFINVFIILSIIYSLMLISIVQIKKYKKQKLFQKIKYDLSSIIMLFYIYHNLVFYQIPINTFTFYLL